MTKLIVRVYVEEDFLNIELMTYEKKCREGQPVEIWAHIKKTAGPAFTVTSPDGEIVFCCGIHDMWPGVGEIWAVFSPLAKKYPHTWIVAKHLLDITFKDYVRLQAALDPVDCPEAIRFDERLGFKPEGLMKRYGPRGEDRVMYALVREAKHGK
ncbi:MAG TPA: N-acetyltransferase [bacterium]|nr:N-acetyltransferase [bacterium]